MTAPAAKPILRDVEGALHTLTNPRLGRQLREQAHTIVNESAKVFFLREHLVKARREDPTAEVEDIKDLVFRHSDFQNR